MNVTANTSCKNPNKLDTINPILQMGNTRLMRLNDFPRVKNAVNGETLLKGSLFDLWIYSLLYCPKVQCISILNTNLTKQKFLHISNKSLLNISETFEILL